MTARPGLPARLFARLGAARNWFGSPAGRRLQTIASLAMSGVIVALLIRAIVAIGWRELIAVTPTTPRYWVLFAAFYLLPPLIDWQIFRPWWQLGWRSLATFFKRRVLNEAVFSYAGDAFLMGWAATRFKIAFDPDEPAPTLGRGDGPGALAADAPIAAIKDVAITSGLAGNLFTLLMLGLAAGLGGEAILGSSIDPTTIRRMIIGFALLIGLSLTILFNRDRVLTLTVAINVRAFWLHMIRVSGSHFLLIATWFVALPAIGIEAWVVLGAMRLVIGRMPVPNKELLFAALAVDLAGAASVQVAALMAAQGVLYLAGHGLSWLIAIAIADRAPDDRAKTLP